MDTSTLQLCGMRALWGLVTPNVRKVYVNVQNNVVSIYFFYNEEPTEIEIELSEDAASELIADFPDPFHINCERYVVPFPAVIENHGFMIYKRFE